MTNTDPAWTLILIALTIMTTGALILGTIDALCDWTERRRRRSTSAATRPHTDGIIIPTQRRKP